MTNADLDHYLECKLQSLWAWNYRDALIRAAVLVALTATTASAQSSAPSSTAPVIFRGEMPSLQFSGEEEPRNLLIAGATARAFFDDNALNNNLHRESDIDYLIQPYVGFDEARKRLHFTAKYSPGVVIHQILARRDLFLDGGFAELDYMLTHHSFVQFLGQYNVATDPWFSAPSEPSNLLDQLGSTLITAPAKITTERAGANLDYQRSRHSLIELSGNFYNLRYEEFPGESIQLLDSQLITGKASYVYRLSPRHTTGVMYQYQDLSLTRSLPAHNEINGLYYVHTVSFTPTSQLQLFAGPEYTRTFNEVALGLGIIEILLPIKQDSWSWAGGASYGWQAKRTSLTASVVHEVGAGGGLLSAVRLTDASAGLRRQLSQSWTAYVRASYSDNNLLDVVNDEAYVRLLMGGGGVTRKLSDSLSLDMRYERERQNRLFDTQAIRADHNWAWLSLNYQFKHRLGGQ